MDIDNLCMAGNWWLPAVSVICMVHTALLLLITFLQQREFFMEHLLKLIVTHLYVSSMVGV